MKKNQKLGKITKGEKGIEIGNDVLISVFGKIHDEYVYRENNGNIIITPVSDEYDARILYNKYINSTYKIKSRTVDGLRFTTIKDNNGIFHDEASVITREDTPSKIAECIALLRFRGINNELEKFEKYIVKA